MGRRIMVTESLLKFILVCSEGVDDSADELILLWGWSPLSIGTWETSI